MLRAVLIGLGGLFTLAMIAASMVMNFLFGFGFGTTPATAWVWGGLSVASDGLKAVMPVLIAYQWRQRHWLRAAVGALILPLVLTYGLLSALGFWAESRGLIVDGRSNQKAGVAEAQADLEGAEKRLANLRDYRLAGIVQADILGMQREPLWEATKECRRAVSTTARAFCKRFDALRAELVLNQEAEAQRRKIESLKSEIKAARSRGAWREADPLGATLAWALTLDVVSVRRGLSWSAAVLVEVVSCLGLLVVEQAGFWAGMSAGAAKPVDKPAAWRLVGEAAEAKELQAGARA